MRASNPRGLYAPLPVKRETSGAVKGACPCPFTRSRLSLVYAYYAARNPTESQIHYGLWGAAWGVWRARRSRLSP
jgi:hypothetical protein